VFGHKGNHTLVADCTSEKKVRLRIAKVTRRQLIRQPSYGKGSGDRTHQRKSPEKKQDERNPNHKAPCVREATRTVRVPKTSVSGVTNGDGLGGCNKGSTFTKNIAVYIVEQGGWVAEQGTGVSAVNQNLKLKKMMATRGGKTRRKAALKDYGKNYEVFARVVP